MDLEKAFDVIVDLIEEFFPCFIVFIHVTLTPMCGKALQTIAECGPLPLDQGIELLLLLIIPSTLNQSPISDEHLRAYDLQLQLLKLIDRRAIDVVDTPVDRAALIQGIVCEKKDQNDEEYKETETGKDLSPYGESKGQGLLSVFSFLNDLFFQFLVVLGFFVLVQAIINTG